MKRVIFGITGGIAAYKALEVIRKIKKENPDIDIVCVMTEGATKFVQPLSFSTLSGNEVLTDMFSPRLPTEQAGKTPVHIELSKSDLVVISPATYNFIGKVASGIADDLLSCVVAAAECPVLFVPSMNSAMWRNPILIENIRKLRKLGYYFMEPETGELACRDVGKGRFPAVESVAEEIFYLLSSSNKLKGKKVIVTAGRTEAYLDPVRYITNSSSGMMGYELARAARLEGADVTLISGPTALTALNLEVVKIKTVEELKKAVLSRVASADILIMTAAVLDYAPVAYSAKKIKSSANYLNLKLKANPDILKLVRDKNKKIFTVGFSLESEEHIKNAKGKLKEKGLDMIIANDVSSISAEETELTLIGKDMKIEKLPRLPKSKAAREVISRIINKKTKYQNPKFKDKQTK